MEDGENEETVLIVETLRGRSWRRLRDSLVFEGFFFFNATSFTLTQLKCLTGNEPAVISVRKQRQMEKCDSGEEEKAE